MSGVARKSGNGEEKPPGPFPDSKGTKMKGKDFVTLASLLTSMDFQTRVHLNTALTAEDEDEAGEALDKARAGARLAVADFLEAAEEAGLELEAA